jgi:hypothetical protein
MKKILIFTVIFLLSCSQAESFVNERDDTQSVSATPSMEPIASTNDDLKSLEERLTKLESAIENNTLAVENLTKSISSSSVISGQNNSPLVEEIDKSDEEDYGKSPNNRVTKAKTMKINLLEDWLLSLGEEKISNTIYANQNSTIEFEGLDEITIDAEKYNNSIPLVFGSSGPIPNTGIVKLPDIFPLSINILNLMKNSNILEFTHTIDYDPSKDDEIKKQFHGQTFEFEYIFK